MTRAKKPVIAIGPLSPRGTGQHFVEDRVHFPTPSRICNAAMPASSLEPGKHWLREPARRGADQHAQYRSRGTGC